jgi:hypothetical protein
METKWLKPFIHSAGGILLAAALLRFVIVAGNAQVLLAPEPLLGIPLRYAVLMVGGFELVVALICLFGRRVGFQIGGLAWLATNFAVFWIGLFWMHCRLQGTCLGSLTDPLHLSRGEAGHIIAFIPLYLLVGSYAALAWFWVDQKTVRLRKPALESLKISCVSCGGHIEFPANAVGRKIQCPHCAKNITLLSPA